VLNRFITDFSVVLKQAREYKITYLAPLQLVRLSTKLEN
jgi:hypothetical protein